MSDVGELWVADVLFTNGQASKRRPVLVLWRVGPDAVVVTVTTASPRSETDVRLIDWAESGLRFPSTARLMRLDTFHDSLLTGRLGRVTPKDARRLNAAWAKHLRLRL